MSRRNALLLALTVGLAAVATLLLARRGRAINAAAAPALAVPAPAVPTSAVAPERRVRSGSAAAQAEEGEQPLPTWARVAIVGAALLAFLAVSLIATRSG